MSDTSSGLVGLLIAFFVFFFFAILFFFLWWLGKKNVAKQKNLIQTLEKKLGLVNQDPKSIYPDLRGKVDGVKVVVDVFFQQYIRSGQVNPGQRPWMRVRAELPLSYTSFLVHPRGKVFSANPADSIDWYIEEMGYPPFDQKYILFKATDASSDISLPPEVRDALIAANPPVAVLGKAISWMKVRTGHSPELIGDAVRSCVDVASAIVKTS